MNDVPTFQNQFTLFAKFGESKSEGKAITLSQSDKWMKQAKMFNKNFTAVDTGVCFKKFKSRTISYDEFEKYLEDLASSKKMDVGAMKQALTNCGMPGVAGTTQVSKVGGVERLTDTSQYTGTHKERFDESGKGKGIEGRADVTDQSGYVSGYKNKDTYAKK